ncbi:hypothetical protein DUGA6_03620 [Duganella sp. HH105]|nr:hypothetical protein DUGA6_03620 [Duganella sp. HH105]OFA06986.1 hypothetical protein DUGA2_03180 [Duganella sp. HH101]
MDGQNLAYSRSMRVVVVDDDPDTRMVLVHVLKALN